MASQSFLVRAISAGALANASAFILQIVRSKMVALLTGTEGVGFWGATQSLSNSLISITTLGIPNGVPVSIAESWNRDENLRVLKSLSATICSVFGLSLVIGIVASPFAKVISSAVLGSEDSYWIVLLALFANPFAAVGLVIACALQGMAMLRAQMALWIVGHGLLTAMCVGSTFIFGTTGISVAWLLYGPVSFALAIVVFYQAIGAESFSRFLESFRVMSTVEIRGAVSKLIPFIRTGATVAILMALSTFTVRIMILNRTGLSELGLFVSVAGISASITTLVQSILSTYAIPNLSNNQNSTERLHSETNKLINTIFLSSFPVLITASVFAEQVLAILFSKDFMPAGDLVRLYLSGELVQLFSWSFVIYFNVLKRPGRISLAKSAEYSVFILVAMSALPIVGILGVGAAYLVSGASAVLAFLLLVPRQCSQIVTVIDILIWIGGFTSLILLQQRMVNTGLFVGGVAMTMCLHRFYKYVKIGGIVT